MAYPISGTWDLEFSNDAEALAQLLDKDLPAADIFLRDSSGQIITNNGQKLLDLEWLRDVLIMLEYDYLGSPDGS
jgi:hypothetical protein